MEDFEIFSKFKVKGYNRFLMGVDEVGRGPLFGPVVAAAVALVPRNRCQHDLVEFKNILLGLKELGVKDSKKLSALKRQKILKEILNIERQINGLGKVDIGGSFELHWCIGELSAKEIDKINILQASLQAMRLSIQGLEQVVPKDGSGILLVDGNKSPYEKIKGPSFVETSICLVKGDTRSMLISLASILAKEYRDLGLQKWDKKFPEYGLIRNAGYPTKEHLQAIKEHGICPQHRKSFRPIRELLANQ